MEPISEPSGPLQLRRRVLTNSAAEFVERRADLEALTQVEGLPQGQQGRSEGIFHPELDQFLPPSSGFDSENPFEALKKSAADFKQALQRFVSVLRERGVDSELGIVIKDADELTLAYALEVISKISENRDNAAKTKSCKKFVERCCRKMEDNKGVVEGVLAMIPTDIYGSLISGSISLILAAVEKNYHKRAEIQTCLAEIPEKLETIERLSEIHYQSMKLKSCASNVMVAILTVLERIVDDITRTNHGKSYKAARNILSKLDPRTKPEQTPSGDQQAVVVSIAGSIPKEEAIQPKGKVKTAITELQAKIEAFQKQVDIDSQERMGRIEGAITALPQIVRNTVRTTVEQCLQQHQRQYTEPTEEREKLQLFRVQNVLYIFFASDPDFDNRTGKRTIYDQARISPRGQQLLSAPYSKDSNIRIAKAWTKGLSRAIVDPTADIKDCLGRLSQLSHDDNDQTQWIVGSDEFTSWLQVQQSQILRIGLQTPPHSLDNALSYTSALLASTMQSTNRVVVLALFCMHRNNESSAVRDSGPVALLTSLNSQLLRVIAEQTTAVDLSTVEGLDNRELASKARTRIKYGIALFSTLLSLLPEGTAVFMIVDSLSRISGSTKDSDRFMEKLMETIHDRDNVLVKTLITDDMPGSYTQRTADISLYVPDTAQGACAVGIAENEWSMDVVKKVSRSWTLDTAADKPRSRKSKDGGRRRKERDDSPADSSTSDTAIEESRSHKGRDTGRRRKERDEVSDESSSSDDC